MFTTSDTSKTAWRKPYNHEKPALCKEGMHAAYTLRGSISYRYIYYDEQAKLKLCRVVVDKIDPSGYDVFKFVGARRKILWSITLSEDEMNKLIKMSDSGALKYVNKLRKKRRK
jgi:hypothetical protein